MESDGVGAPPHPGPSEAIRRVEDAEWPMVAWLFQLLRHDLALVVRGLPYEDGRYAHGPLEAYPSPDHVGYAVWRDHPNTSRPAPIAFALCEAVTVARWSMAALWVSPVVRGEGVGTRLALDVLARHGDEWEVAFQHDNVSAGRFWRRIGDLAFPSGWDESRRPVTRRVDVPADHVIVGTRPPSASAPGAPARAG